MRSKKWQLWIALVMSVLLVQQVSAAQDGRDFAKIIYQAAQRTHWIEDGDAHAHHVAYVLMEPNCWYCKKLYGRMQPLIASGDLKVRWIIAAFLQPNSMGKAATILQAKIPAKVLYHDFVNGSLRENNNLSAATMQSLEKNGRFVSDYGLATPTTIYKTATQYRVTQGAVPADELKKLVASMNPTF